MTTSRQLSDDAQRAHDYLLQIGKLTIDFAKVERTPQYAPGKRENDVEHSFHLGVSAIELAANFHPELDMGLVAQFSLVHDLPEVHAGDISTFNITDEELERKHAAEKVATERLLTELPPHLAQLLRRYEEQTEPEARFVRFIDKLLPAIINMVNPELSRSVFKQEYDVVTSQDLLAGEAQRAARLQMMFPEFDFIYIVRGLVVNSLVKDVFEDEYTA